MKIKSSNCQRYTRDDPNTDGGRQIENKSDRKNMKSKNKKGEKQQQIDINRHGVIN